MVSTDVSHEGVVVAQDRLNSLLRHCLECLRLLGDSSKLLLEVLIDLGFALDLPPQWSLLDLALVLLLLSYFLLLSLLLFRLFGSDLLGHLLDSLVLLLGQSLFLDLLLLQHLIL